jgi:hypothetical protein
MREWRVIATLLLFSSLVVLTTCELQLNKGGNGLTLRVQVPAILSRGAGSTPALATKGKSLSGGSTVTATISTQAGATFASAGPVAINGNTSVDFSFSLPPAGMYQVSAQLLDGSGAILNAASAPLTVPATPAQSSSVVLSLVSSGQLSLINSATGLSVSQGSTIDFSSSSPVPFQVTNNDPSKTLYIGSGALTITNNTPDDFTISTPLPPTPIPPGGSSDFDITLVTAVTATETVTLTTSDTANSPFTFYVYSPC